MTKQFIMSCFAFLFISVIVSAQINKGAFLLGGELSHYDSKTTSSPDLPVNTAHSSGLDISFGRAFSENMVYGIRVEYFPSSNKNFFNGSMWMNTKYAQFGAGLFARSYRLLAKDLYFFAEAGINYLGYSQVLEDTLGNRLGKVTQSGVLMYLTPGVSYRIYRSLYLEILIPNLFSASYVVTKDHENAAMQKQFIANTSLNTSGLDFLGVGFHLLLQKKKSG